MIAYELETPPPSLSSPSLLLRPSCLSGLIEFMDMESRDFATRDDLWRIQETLSELSATQALHSERIMRLEQKTPDGSRSRNMWGSTSPFPGSLASSHHGELALWSIPTNMLTYHQNPRSTLLPKHSEISTQTPERA